MLKRLVHVLWPFGRHTAKPVFPPSAQKPAASQPASPHSVSKPFIRGAPASGIRIPPMEITVRNSPELSRMESAASAINHFASKPRGNGTPVSIGPSRQRSTLQTKTTVLDSHSFHGTQGPMRPREAALSRRINLAFDPRQAGTFISAAVEKFGGESRANFSVSTIGPDVLLGAKVAGFMHSSSARVFPGAGDGERLVSEAIVRERLVTVLSQCSNAEAALEAMNREANAFNILNTAVSTALSNHVGNGSAFNGQIRRIIEDSGGDWASAAVKIRELS